ncbi:pyrimidine dimer DNA glycosylase/endonuclease V [Leucobacter celer]|uniref:pyrimidine dimer DNA glycosylase/endonuclease V n=1 Tax=Leucobacter celer TaxID=668625 RepID=UPI0006A79E86|nr:pyrimidine dimer DNA glycosylase/endonuclease V [Leucobacter celer]
MRIWSLHPSHLDRMGLLACWRETLLAQAVLAGRTKGYRNHPQLERFRAQADPLAAVGTYLSGVAGEARDRGYRFDASRILRPAPASGDSIAQIPVTQGQLDFEWQHLGRKLHERSAEHAARWEQAAPIPHPLFRVVPGDIEPWERASQSGGSTKEA